MYRICAIAFFISVSFPLSAQWVDSTWCKRKDVTCNSSREIKLIDKSDASTRLSPWGEMTLYPVGYTEFDFNLTTPGDSLQVSVFNKEGIPFKSLEWVFKDSSPVRLNNIPWKVCINAVGKATLRIKPSFSVNEQVAVIHVSRISVVPPDTLITTVDNISSTNKQKTVLGAEKRLFQTSTGGKTQLISWEFRYLPVLGRKQLQEQIGKIDTIKHPPQKKQLAPSTVFLLPRLDKTRNITYDDFQPGDTLFISIGTKGKAIKRVSLLTGKNAQWNMVRESKSLIDTIVVPKEKVPLTLRFYDGFGLKKKFADVSILRVRPVKPDLGLRITDTLSAKGDTTTYDTLLLTVVDDSLMLTPIWNLDSKPYGQIEVQIPKEGGKGYQLIHAAYWIGIGRRCLNDYAVFEATVPADWSKPGAPVALGAYGMGRPVILPTHREEEVLCAFSKTRKTQMVKPQQPKLPKLPTPLSLWPGEQYTGLVTAEKLSSQTQGMSLATGTPSYNFFACFQNVGTVNTWPISLKVVAYYKKATTVPLEKETKTGSAQYVALPK